MKKHPPSTCPGQISGTLGTPGYKIPKLVQDQCPLLHHIPLQEPLYDWHVGPSFVQQIPESYCDKLKTSFEAIHRGLAAYHQLILSCYEISEVEIVADQMLPI